MTTGGSERANGHIYARTRSGGLSFACQIAGAAYTHQAIRIRRLGMLAVYKGSHSKCDGVK
jgi:hypothetical protein